MKKNISQVFLISVFIFILPKANAQCSTNPIYEDMLGWVENSSHGIRMQITIINTALVDGSHFYTAWGKDDFIFNGPPKKGFIINRCRFISSKERNKKRKYTLCYFGRKHDCIKYFPCR